MRLLALEAAVNMYVVVFNRHSFICNVCGDTWIRDPEGSENLAAAQKKFGIKDLVSVCHDCWLRHGGPQIGKEHLN